MELNANSINIHAIHKVKDYVDLSNLSVFSEVRFQAVLYEIERKINEIVDPNSSVCKMIDVVVKETAQIRISGCIYTPLWGTRSFRGKESYYRP
jgi:hypothetical protein